MTHAPSCNWIRWHPKHFSQHTTRCCAGGSRWCVSRAMQAFSPRKFDPVDKTSTFDITCMLSVRIQNLCIVFIIFARLARFFRPLVTKVDEEKGIPNGKRNKTTVYRNKRARTNLEKKKKKMAYNPKYLRSPTAPHPILGREHIRTMAV